MTKFKRTLAVMVTAVGFVLISSAASALPSISLVWQDTLSPTIGTPAVNASSAINADIVLTGDSTGVGIKGVFISIEFDVTELQAIGAQELPAVNLPGMANGFTPLSPGPSGIDNVLGLIEGFEQQTLATGLNQPISVTLGSVRFHVLAPGGDNSDIDVIASLQNTGVDEISTDVGPGSANFIGASVTGPVPEPTTALLVVAGLAGLGYAGRRSLR